MPNTVTFGCGDVGHNAFTSLGVSLWVINTPADNGFWQSVKTRTFTRLDSQAGLLLYTTWAQYYATLISVTNELIHTIHRAYKEISNSKKGIL